MTCRVIVLDRGRPIAKHTALDLEVGRELVSAYRALGWPEDKVILQTEQPEYTDKAA
jgi:hypothetical protein